MSQLWWCTPVIPALRRLRQEGRKFHISLCYGGRSCLQNSNPKKEHSTETESRLRPQHLGLLRSSTHIPITTLNEALMLSLCCEEERKNSFRKKDSTVGCFCWREEKVFSPKYQGTGSRSITWTWCPQGISWGVLPRGRVPMPVTSTVEVGCDWAGWGGLWLSWVRWCGLGGRGVDAESFFHYIPENEHTPPARETPGFCLSSLQWHHSCGCFSARKPLWGNVVFIPSLLSLPFSSCFSLTLL
jgi:hypothetical protein